MVKRPRIAGKPSPPPPPEADAWVSEQLDPEIKPPATPPATPEPTAQPREKGKPLYPHRISYDTDAGQYRRLKKAVFESDRKITEIVREAVEDWLKSRNY